MGDPAPDGSLTLSVIHRTLLNWIVLLAFIGGAIALARQSLAVRATAVGVGITALILIDVFQPMLMHEMVNSVFLWGAVLLVVIWVAAAFLRRRSRRVAPPPVSVTPPVVEPPPTDAAPPEGPTAGGEHHG